MSEQPTSGMPASISPPTAEVLRLAQSGVSDETVIVFVKRSQERFGLSDEMIIYLKDLGVAPEVITAMIKHDGGLAIDSTASEAAVEPGPTSDSEARATAFTRSLHLTEPGPLSRTLGGAGNRTAILFTRVGGPTATEDIGFTPIADGIGNRLRCSRKRL